MAALAFVAAAFLVVLMAFDRFCAGAIVATKATAERYRELEAAKAAALARWPEARLRCMAHGSWAVVLGTGESPPRMGWGRSPAEAWEAAGAFALRLEEGEGHEDGDG